MEGSIVGKRLNYRIGSKATIYTPSGSKYKATNFAKDMQRIVAELVTLFSLIYTHPLFHNSHAETHLLTIISLVSKVSLLFPRYEHKG